MRDIVERLLDEDSDWIYTERAEAAVEITRLRAELAEARKAPTEPHLEFRPDENGEFDEIVARFADGMVHVETMSDKDCYVGFSWNDGRFCQWYISSGKALKYHHEQGKDGPVKRAMIDKG